MPSQLLVHKYTCPGIYPEDRLITGLVGGCVLPMARKISWAGVNSNPAELCNTFLSANRSRGKISSAGTCPDAKLHSRSCPGYPGATSSPVPPFQIAGTCS